MKNSNAWLAFIALLAGAVLAVAARGEKQEDKAPLSKRPWSEVELKTEKLADGIYVIYGEGGNIGVSAGEDGALLVDSQFAQLTARVQAAVAKVSPKPIRLLANTHWHFDHTGGNGNLGNAGVLIFAHDNARTRLAAGAKTAFGEVPPASHAALPIVTYADGISLHLNGDDVRLIHVNPAHTDGDTLVHFKKGNVIHMGDCWMSISYPYVDAQSGGRYSGFIEAADKAIGLADGATKIIPGHGPVSDKKGLQAWRDMLVSLRERVKEQASAGKSLEEIQKLGLTKEWDERWGHFFIKPEMIVAAAHRDLQ